MLNHIHHWILSFFLFLACSLIGFAQDKATVQGKLTDPDGKPAEAVAVSVMGLPGGVSTDQYGKYALVVPAGEEITLVFSHISFESYKMLLNLKNGQVLKLDQQLKRSSNTLGDVTIEDKQTRTSTLIRLDPKLVDILPSASGGIEAMIKTMPGVVSNNELSSQYSVRGGNFDENLVYVNDVQIYRPFLVRSGQQEGLSFINPDMVSSILFSAGGFDAKYGDKLSSVLDIKYRTPKEFAGSASGSLLGGALHLEGTTEGYRLSYQVGLRRKSTRYLLNSLNTEGDYRPSFTDFQAHVTYDLTARTEISFIGNYARNNYLFVPLTATTKFGTVNEALQLTIYFDGQELDAYETFQGAFTTTVRPNDNLKLKFIASGFRSLESETFDIQGQYFLDELEKDIGKEEFGEAKLNRGVGTFLTHARNNLDATVLSFAQRGYLNRKKSFFQWGVKVQHEEIGDRLSEWNMIDSAGFSLPKTSDSIGYVVPSLQPSKTLEILDVLKTEISVRSLRLMGFVQNDWDWRSEDSVDYTLHTGVRFNYWDLNNQLLGSPRVSFSVDPNWKKDVIFRAAVGVYHQPPFYRELRDLNGVIHTDVKAQQSTHFVLGSDYLFEAWKRPFKLVTEIYYKDLKNLIPYEVDNVRIRYYAENNAKGYATGLDLKVNGEFVKGVDSWISLSIMQTKEDIVDDFYYERFNQDGERIIKGFTSDQVVTDSVRHEPGFIPRPTDQRVTFNMFFQDYLPKNPNFKMHLNMVYGTGIPFGPPSFERFRDTLRIPDYRRVDIGFSAQVVRPNSEFKPKNPLRHLKSMWISLEVFNLLGINNTISYLWIKDVTNRQYAVPNHLTFRLINLKLVTKF